MTNPAPLTFIRCERDGEEIKNATPHYMQPQIGPQEEADKLDSTSLLSLIFASAISIALYSLGA